jgi:hypothetical protein
MIERPAPVAGLFAWDSHFASNQEPPAGLGLVNLLPGDQMRIVCEQALQ